MKRNDNRKAFTIVELVIVIAVIAILATVLVPVFGDMIDKAHTSAAKQGAKNAYTSYIIDNNGIAPELMAYKHSNGKVVALEQGVPTNVYETEDEFFEAYGVTPFEMSAGILYAITGDTGNSDNGNGDSGRQEGTAGGDWEGKTILFLGDDIPLGQAGSAAIDTVAIPYPQIVAERLGMNLQNYAISGSTIAYRKNYGGAFATYEEFLAAEKDPDLYYQVIDGQSYTSYKYTGLDNWLEHNAINSTTGEITWHNNRTISPLYENPGSITITLPDDIEMYIAAYDSNGDFVPDKFGNTYLSESTKTVTKEEAAYIRIMVRTKRTELYVQTAIAEKISVVDGNGNKAKITETWRTINDALRTPLTARFDLMTDDADVIVVHCGTNDFVWTDVGTPTDTTNLTFCGALNNLILGLQQKYPNKPIIFMTPLQRMQDGYTTPEAENIFGYTLNDYRNIILTTCASYGIPVIDTYESGPSPYKPEQVSWFDEAGTHPNQLGHYWLGKVVIEELQKLYHVKDHREQWTNKYLAPLEFGSMSISGDPVPLDHDNLFYKRARSSAAVTAEEEISITVTVEFAAKFRLFVYDADGTLRHNDWRSTSATFTVYAGESFRFCFSAADADRVLTEDDLVVFAEAIKIEVK